MPIRRDSRPAPHLRIRAAIARHAQHRRRSTAKLCSQHELTQSPQALAFILRYV